MGSALVLIINEAHWQSGSRDDDSKELPQTMRVLEWCLPDSVNPSMWTVRLSFQLAPGVTKSAYQRALFWNLVDGGNHWSPFISSSRCICKSLAITVRVKVRCPFSLPKNWDETCLRNSAYGYISPGSSSWKVPIRVAVDRKFEDAYQLPYENKLGCAQTWWTHALCPDRVWYMTAQALATQLDVFYYSLYDSIRK